MVRSLRFPPHPRATHISSLLRFLPPPPLPPLVRRLHPPPGTTPRPGRSRLATCSSLIGGVSKQKKYASDRGPPITAPCFIRCVRYVTRQSATAVAAALTAFFRVPIVHERTRASDRVYCAYIGKYRHNNPFLPPASTSYRDAPAWGG